MFRRRLIDGWHAEVDSRKMSANLLADLDFEDDTNSVKKNSNGKTSVLDLNGSNNSSNSTSKKKKKKKKKKDDNARSRKEMEERLAEEERELAAKILSSRQVRCWLFRCFFSNFNRTMISFPTLTTNNVFLSFLFLSLFFLLFFHFSPMQDAQKAELRRNEEMARKEAARRAEREELGRQEAVRIINPHCCCS